MKYFQILLLLGINISIILLGQSIELPQKFMNKDEIKNIPIFIYNVTNLESIHLKIEYDENVVLAEDIIKNPVGILDGGYTFTTNLTEPGIIELAIGSNSANVDSVSGMIAQITFESIGELGEFSALTFLDAQINSNWQVPRVHGSIEIVLDELFIAGQDNSEIGAEHLITLGMCDGCDDSWSFSEDEADYPNPFSGGYTNLNFYHYDWNGTIDAHHPVNEDSTTNFCCAQFEFKSDYRKQHSFRELTSWGIKGSTGGGLSSDIDINLSWDSGKLISNSDSFKIFIYVGDTKDNMKEMNNISVLQSDLNLVNNEPNIWVKMGVCADTGESTIYYQDFDGDGLGSGTSRDYCFGFVPEEGWVTNSDDRDDYCYSNVYDCSDPPVCDGTAVEDCNGECGGSATEDECSVCNGDNSFCTDCNGDLGGPNGIPFDGDEAYLDGCDECVGGNTLDDACIYDCSGELNGISTIDNCGTCDDNSSNDCVQDCAGEWGGNLDLDACGICGGPGDTFECSCEDIPPGDCDCNGNILDECGICNGDNSTCKDCYGVINGGAYIDACGDCIGGTTGIDACLIDCSGEPGGAKIVDACGICGGNGIPDGDCNCDGEEFDICGICGGSGIPDGDCDCNGNKFDDCGECGGTAVYDESQEPYEYDLNGDGSFDACDCW